MKFRKNKAVVMSIIIASTLLACAPQNTQPEINQTEIAPTTGIFSEAAEAFYQERFKILVEAFKRGQGTTDYDTELYFGTNLNPIPIARGNSNIPADTLSEVIEYTRVQNSDSFLIYQDGKIVSENYFGDITDQTLINAKSLAKPLGVIAVGRALKAGYIQSLDQPVSDFIVEWKDTDKADIKLRYLLDMRSGLLPQAPAQSPDDVLNRAYLHPHHDEVIIHEYPLTHEPGSIYQYSNANSELVSVIIERATGQAYQDWLAEQVLAPLGAPGGKIWLNRDGGVAHSGCCVKLTSETYLKLAVMIMNGGEWNGDSFLPTEFIETMTTSTQQNRFTGMGVFLGKEYKEYRGSLNPDMDDYSASYHGEPYLDPATLLFDGNGNQVVYILPSQNMVIARFGNRPKGEPKWDNAYLPNTVLRSLEP